MWHSPGPLSDDWDIPEGEGVKFLIGYLKYQQEKAYGKTIVNNSPPFTYAVLTRNMKLLLKEHNEETIKRAIALGCLKSEHPFSTKFIKEMAQWLQGLRESPTQRFYQNKF